MNEKCILDESKLCNDCGECDRCDLDGEKICDNCGKCIEVQDVASIKIDKIFMNPNEYKEN